MIKQHVMHPASGPLRRLAYEDWTIEELRALGAQLQVKDATRMSRGELLEILDASPAASGAHENAAAVSMKPADGVY